MFLEKVLISFESLYKDVVHMDGAITRRNFNLLIWREATWIYDMVSELVELENPEKLWIMISGNSFVLLADELFNNRNRCLRLLKVVRGDDLK